MSTTIGSPQLARKGGGAGRLPTGEFASAGGSPTGMRACTGRVHARDFGELGLRVPNMPSEQVTPVGAEVPSVPSTRTFSR